MHLRTCDQQLTVTSAQSRCSDFNLTGKGFVVSDVSLFNGYSNDQDGTARPMTAVRAAGYTSSLTRGESTESRIL